MKRQGFTLLECLVALLVTAMIAILMQLTFKIYEHVDHERFDDTAQWYIFLRDLESSNNKYEFRSVGESIIHLNSRPRVFYCDLVINRKKHVLNFNSTERGTGYLPILQHVKSFHTQQVGKTNCVKLDVEFLSGEQQHAVVKFIQFVNKDGKVVNE